jgi:hypothetical protein
MCLTKMCLCSSMHVVARTVRSSPNCQLQDNEYSYTTHCSGLTQVVISSPWMLCVFACLFKKHAQMFARIFIYTHNTTCKSIADWETCMLESEQQCVWTSRHIKCDRGMHTHACAERQAERERRNNLRGLVLVSYPVNKDTAVSALRPHISCRVCTWQFGKQHSCDDCGGQPFSTGAINRPCLFLSYTDSSHASNATIPV